MTEKGKSNLIITVVCVVIMAALVAGYYFYITHKDFRDQEKVKENIASLLAVDVEEQYPDSPVEVIKYYSDLIMCVYNDELTQEQFQDFAAHIRALFDEELLAQNSEEEYIKQLQEEAESYRKENKRISSYMVSSNKDVEYQEMDSQDYAVLFGYYHVKQKSERLSTCEEFMLRRDEDGKWRILGWQLSSGTDAE